MTTIIPDFGIIDFEEKHIEQGLNLLAVTYGEEQATIPCLPTFETLEETPREELKFFAENKLGVAAVDDNGILLGYLCAYPPYKGAYNSQECGSWAPLHGHAVAKLQQAARIAIWEQLVQKAMTKWRVAGSKYHSITLFNHEEDLQRSLSMYQYGYRCADAMRCVCCGSNDVTSYDLTTENSRFSVRQITEDDFPVMRPLRKALALHLTEAPCFCLDSEEDIAEYIASKESQEGLVTYGLFVNGDTLIGFIDTCFGAENFISSGDKVLNIHGMYVQPEYRGQKLAQSLVKAAIMEAENQGCTQLGVDYETMNPTAVRFWEKYFRRYTLSMVRWID